MDSRNPVAGYYEIVMHFPPNANRANNVPVIVGISGQLAKTIPVNERTQTGAVSLGKFALPAGKSVTITLANEGTEGFVVADGVQLLKTD